LDRPLTTLLAAELLRRFKGKSPSRVGATHFPGSSVLETIRTRSRVGGQNLTGFFRSSTYAQSSLLGRHSFIIFQTELAIDTNATASKTEATVSKIDGEVSKLREEIRGQVRPVRAREAHSTHKNTDNCIDSN
jgi:hypothetical protein